MSLLEVTDLQVSFNTSDGVVQAVRGISFSIGSGQTLGIVGESGSGKSVSTQTLLGLNAGARVTGSALFEGQDLLAMNADQLRRIRGAQISMIFQDPLSSLHPLYKVGWQIVEMIRTHEPDVSKSEARKRAVELLGMVGIPQPDRRVDDFPHQFSGGMRQRAMIAMALALSPKLIIADEPTTALDATVQAQILDLMQRLQREFDTALIMITHDLGVIADIADDVLVMYAGRPVEHTDRRSLYYRPHHPYTKGLLESIPQSTGARERLTPIPGQPPSLINLPTGCSFHPRCAYVMDKCITDGPELRPVGSVADDGVRHDSACWLPREATGLTADTEQLRTNAVLEGRTGAAKKIADQIAGDVKGPVAS
jgi:oligopeptide/dipeptide ABC transporter ATP-binding protein